MDLSYIPQPARPDFAGVVKVGAGLSVTADGTLSTSLSSLILTKGGSVGIGGDMPANYGALLLLNPADDTQEIFAINAYQSPTHNPFVINGPNGSALYVNPVGDISTTGGLYSSIGQFSPANNQDGIIVNVPAGYAGAAIHFLDSAGGNLLAITLDEGMYPDIFNEYGQFKLFGGEFTFLSGGGGLYTPDPIHASTAELTGASPTDISLVIRGAAGQTANLQEWEDFSGNFIASVDSEGTINTNGNLGAAGAVSAWGDLYARLTNSSSWTRIGAIGTESQSGIAFGSEQDALLYRSGANTIALDCGYAPVNAGAVLQFAGYNNSLKSTASVGAAIDGRLMLTGNFGGVVFGSTNGETAVSAATCVDGFVFESGLNVFPQQPDTPGIQITLPPGSTADAMDIFDAGSLIARISKFGAGAALTLGDGTLAKSPGGAWELDDGSATFVVGLVNAAAGFAVGGNASYTPGLTQTISLPGGGTLTVLGGIITGYAS